MNMISTAAGVLCRKVRLPNVGDHVRHGPCNNEIQQPVCRAAYGDSHRAYVHWEDL
jgi:hypothetical protein